MGILPHCAQGRNSQVAPRMAWSVQNRASVAGRTCIHPRQWQQCSLRTPKKHIPTAWDWTSQKTDDNDVAIIVDPYPEQPNEAVASDASQPSFAQEERLSEFDPPSIQQSRRSHPMETREQAAGSQRIPQRRFDQYDIPSSNSSSDEAKPELEEASIIETACLLYTSPSPRDLSTSRMPSSA